jgi:predicted NAD-dependent protein-ADP-ribosyltransferase YbiA (DUF1768 family)
MEILKFYSKSKDGQCLSNFADIEIQLENKIFSTGEHAFHYMKYYNASKYANSDKRKNELLNYAKKFEKPSVFKSSLDAKKGGGKKGFLLEPGEITNWNDESVEVQNEICKYKYNNCNEVKKFLDENKNKYLLHQDNRANENTIWGGREDKKTGKIIGQNKLGQIWLELNKN